MGFVLRMPPSKNLLILLICLDGVGGLPCISTETFSKIRTGVEGGGSGGVPDFKYQTNFGVPT